MQAAGLLAGFLSSFTLGMCLNASLSWDLHFYTGVKDFSPLPCLDENRWSQPAFLPK